MMRNIFIQSKYQRNEIDPDEVLLDATNLPEYDTHQFEGRLERPIQPLSIILLASVFAIIGLVFFGRLFFLQIAQGSDYRELAENNRLSQTTIFADRGVIYDRNGELLAWNIPKEETDYNLRAYIADPGFAHILGYVDYPKQDSSGNYYETETKGISGLEQVYNDSLAGKNGLQLVEVNALQKTTSANLLRDPENGDVLHTTLDANLQRHLFNSIKSVADEVGFTGGAGVIMDVQNGDVIALTSYPEFDPAVMTAREDSDMIADYFSDPRNVFLNRMVQGLYTPGSIVKPYVAAGALEEEVITPNTVIVSNGSISIPNPYYPDNPSVFNDWKAHGPLTVRDAIAHSSNVFFYEVGGGFQNQEGIGIKNIEKYVRAFGFGSPFRSEFFKGPEGTIPNEEWKKTTFAGDDWRLGDTYFTAIGQYGFQITPLQAIRSVASIANGGYLVEPRITQNESVYKRAVEGVSQSTFKIIQEGMRKGAIEGTARAINVDYVTAAAKTGTAELGVSKAKVNSWITGYYPYENPKYAFVIMLEQGKRTNLVGASAAMRRFLDALYIENPNYFADLL